MSKWFARLVGTSVSVLGVAAFLVTVASADVPSQSTNYRFDESVLGAGGLVQSSSTNYQTIESVGDTGVGNSASTNFQTEAGSVTTDDPALSFGVLNGNASFGSFSPAAAATATATIAVSNYTSWGYVVQIVGNAPKYGSHTISSMATTGPSVSGSEQFGLNLVANTSPVAFGADPLHGLFAVGSAATNYNSTNQYRYVSGETIASAPKSSGVTTYTLSYIVNVGSLTPAGQYTSNQVVICTGTF